VLAAVGGAGGVMDAASGGGVALAVAAAGAAVVAELAHAATARAPAASRTPANGLTNNSDDGRETDGNI
jgi:hypothetical protein